MFDLINFILKLQEIKMKAPNGQMFQAFFAQTIETEIKKDEIGMKAAFHTNLIPVEIFLHIYKLCEEFEIDEVNLYTYDGEPKILIRKKLGEKNE